MGVAAAEEALRDEPLLHEQAARGETWFEYSEYGSMGMVCTEGRRRVNPRQCVNVLG